VLSSGINSSSEQTLLRSSYLPAHRPMDMAPLYFIQMTCWLAVQLLHADAQQPEALMYDRSGACVVMSHPACGLSSMRRSPLADA
jgi:hypothetical protein